MNRSGIKWSVVSAVALGLVLAWNGNTAVAAGKGYSWADVAKWPDFTTGYWVAAGRGGRTGVTGGPPGGGRAGGPPGMNLPFTAEFQKEMAAQRAKQRVGVGSCEPMGVIADSGSAFVFSKDTIVIGGLSDWYNVFRRVYMDGRDHPKDAEPSYFGHSIGHWEGGTLVIDTVAIRGEAQIMQGIAVGNYDTHVVERMRLVDKDTLEISKTVTNPSVFKEPYSTTRTLKRTAGEYLETYCWQDRESSEVVNLDL